MLNPDQRQQAMLEAMGITLPWSQQLETVVESTSQAEDKPRAAAPPLARSSSAPSASQTRPHSAEHARQHISKADRNSEPDAFPTQSPNPEVETIERAQAIACMSWDELAAAVQQCEACALCKSRTQGVFSAGSPQAQWMIIGEAPGENEDKQGEPFVGQAGKLLDRMLLPLGLARHPTEKQKPVCIANVLKCRPPRNRNPEPQEMAMCEPYLKRQIDLVNPRIILAMGRFAVQTLLQTHEAIGRLRGRIHHYQGVPVVVTYHPAYLLRNPVDKRKSWADLCLAADIFHDSSAGPTV